MSEKSIFRDEWTSHRALRHKLTNHPHLYLAGKVEKEPRRWGCANWSSDDEPVVDGECDGFEFSYVGPFVSADRCSMDHGAWSTNDHLHNNPLGDCASKVLSRSLLGISRADVVVASLIGEDPFGTLFELGFAYATKPTIVIANPETWSRELWMATTSATALVWAESPREGLLRLFTEAAAGRYGGHSSYREYLKSDHWAKKRAETLLRFGNRCALCGASDGLNVHHNTYERLGREAPTDLVVLCREHHEKFHDILPEAEQDRARIMGGVGGGGGEQSP